MQDPSADSRRPPARMSTAEALAGVYRNVRVSGWGNFLELLMLSVVWFIGILSAVTLVEFNALAKNVQHLGVLLITLLLCLPFALIGPVTVGLFAAVDAMWFHEAAGPFEVLGAFFRGFRHRYLRSVGLGAIWVVVVLAVYSNFKLDAHHFHGPILLAVYVLVLYVSVFVILFNIYTIYVVAKTELSLWRSLGIGMWQALANPVFSFGVVPPMVIAVFLGLLFRPLMAMLVGGTIASFSVSAVRFAPLRHPLLPEMTLPPPPDDAVDEVPQPVRKGKKRR